MDNKELPNFTWDDVDFNTPIYPDDFCSHLWINYYGLTETYDYCQYCDMKRNEK